MVKLEEGKTYKPKANNLGSKYVINFSKKVIFTYSGNGYMVSKLGKILLTEKEIKTKQLDDRYWRAVKSNQDPYFKYDELAQRGNIEELIEISFGVTKQTRFSGGISQHIKISYNGKRCLSSKLSYLKELLEVWQEANKKVGNKMKGQNKAANLDISK